jgi:hypothetical protein
MYKHNFRNQLLNGVTSPVKNRSGQTHPPPSRLPDESRWSTISSAFPYSNAVLPHSDEVVPTKGTLDVS